MTEEKQGQEVGGKSYRAAGWLIWSLYGLTICLAIVWPAGADLLSRDGSKNALQIVGEALVSLATPVVFAVVGALILSRQPRNTIGWLLTVPVGAYVVGGQLDDRIGHLAQSHPEPTVSLLVTVWFNNWGWLLLIFPLLLILLLFPNGRPPTARWRWVGVAAIAWAALFLLLATFQKQIKAPGLVLDNPIGVLGENTVQLLAGMWVFGLFALVVACAASLFVRYRRTDATGRRQIGWLLYACAFFLVVYGGGLVSGLGGSSSTGGQIWEVFFGLSLLTVPAAIGIAILRYRLYEIDIIINRTLVYGSLTLMLVLVYSGGVTTTQALFRTLTGQQQQPQLAVVVSTLAIAALFNPLRRRLQSFIDRRFFRNKYDARKTLEAFSAKLREETDLEALHAELVSVVRETMQPERVSLWLLPGTPRSGAREE